MDILSPKVLKDLLHNQHTPCVSLFLPTHHQAGIEIQQDPTRFQQLLRTAEQQLLAQNWESEHIEAFLKPAWDVVHVKKLWLHPDEGLAVLCSSEESHVYQLPFPVQECVVIADHFYLKPLLPLLTNEIRFLILSLSHNKVRMLEGTPFGVKEILLPETVPTSMAETLRYKAQHENLLESHSSASGALVGKGGHHAAVFHGQGVGIDEDKEHLLRYFQQIDRGLHELLHNETAPLILAGVAYLLPIYREANTYPHLMAESIEGNPDRASMKQLRTQAWKIMQADLLKAQQAALLRYKEPADIHLISDNLSEIVPAAFAGRVDTLFVAIDQVQWGHVKPEKPDIAFHEQQEAGDEDLLDVAARQTLLHGGTVYALDYTQMPDKAFAATIFRY